MVARSILGLELLEEEIVERCREVGGIPRHIYAEQSYFGDAMLVQHRALDSLPVEQAQRMVKREIVRLDETTPPKSPLMGYQLAADVNSKFRKPKALAISAWVAAESFVDQSRSLFLGGGSTVCDVA